MLPMILLAGYLVLFTILGIAPYARDVWFAENLPILIVVGGIVWVHLKYHRFSNLALLFMSVLVVIHTIGGHYTFARVPFDWFTDLVGAERNHYDRFGHFSVGFYAFGIAEVLLAKRLVGTLWLLFLVPILSIFAVASLYEIFEWRFALLADPEAGLAVLGSQGDVWDAQKDMLMDGLGAVLATVVFFTVRRRDVRSLRGEAVSE